MAKDLVVLGVVLFLGFFYYKFSISNVNDAKNMAFMIKIFLLILSFVLAFVEKDYIKVGESLAFGGRSSVMILILFEIVDAFVDKKNKQ